MLRDLLSNRAILGGLVFCVVLVGCTQFYSWQVRRTSQEELERTTRTVQQLKKQNETRAAEVEKPPPPGETVQSGHWHGDKWHATEPHRQDTLPTTSLETPEPKVLSGESPPADASLTQLKVVKEKIDGINARIQAKYPEFAELTTLTPEEIVARYPTEADMLVLQKRVDDFLEEFLQDIRTVFADAPIELREAAYDMVYKQLEQSWGTEATIEYMEILRGTVE